MKPKQILPYLVTCVIVLPIIFVLGYFHRGTRLGEAPPCKSDTTWLAEKVWIKHDTLVYMVTRDSMKTPVQDTGGIFRMRSAGWELSGTPHEGSTRDTIYKHEIIYY